MTKRWVLFFLICFFLSLSGCAKKIPLRVGTTAVEWEYFFIKNVTAKSDGAYSSGADAVTDGDITTKWQSAEEDDTSWVALHLKSVRPISSVRIAWGTVAARWYDIQVPKKSGKPWKTIANVEDGVSEEIRTIKFAPVLAKSIRIFCIEKTRETGGYAIGEIELNPAGSAASAAIQITGSSTMAGNLPEMAADGDMSTRWESEHGVDPSWISIDLGTKKKIRKVKIKWEAASAAEYTIDVSNDGMDWKTVKRINDGQKEETRTLRFSPVKARHIRIIGTKRMTEWGYSIWEIEIYE